MYEDYVLFDGNPEEFDPYAVQASPTPQVLNIDYEEIENAFYNALYRIDQEQQERESSQLVNSDFVDFATSTDSQMITGNVVAEPTSSAQQTTMYLLDIRNVLLIALLTWLCITLYSKIKNALTNYYGKEE